MQKTYISSSIYDSINIFIHFVQFVHCLYVQKTYIQRLFQLACYISFVQFVHYLYAQKTCKSHFSQLLVQVLHSLYNVCMYKKHTFQVLSHFWSKLCTRFGHFVHYLYICRNVMQLFCTFIIIQSFYLYNHCIQNIYKFSVLYNVCIHYVQFLYKIFGKGNNARFLKKKIGGLN